LKLDHNEFGSKGVIELSKSLAINPVLRILSLTYCGIDFKAAQALFEILIYTRSALEEINLSGNMLGGEGVCKVLFGASVAKSLKKILLADNQFQDDDEFLKAIAFCMEKNKKLARYDFKYNNITDRGKTETKRFFRSQNDHRGARRRERLARSAIRHSTEDLR